jgi:hypothetical protein
MTEYKYFRMPTPRQDGRGTVFKPERAKAYDLVLADIIENGTTAKEASRKHGVNHKSFVRVIRVQRELGLVIPVSPNGRKKNKYDPNGIYKYWVEITDGSTDELRTTKDFGKMMDALIEQHINGDTLEVVSERYGIPIPTIDYNINRCRKAGSPIPHLPQRDLERNEPNWEIYECVNGHSRVKASVVLQWVDKRLQGYSCAWIGREYGVHLRTVAVRTKPFMPA